MATRFPQFKPGMDPSDVSASEMQHMSDEVAALSSLRAGPNISIHKSPGGLVISGASTAAATPARSLRWAAVVIPPKPGDDSLTVREIAVKQEGVPFSYRWASEYRMEALPGFGHTFADFQGIAFSDVERDEDGEPIEPVQERLPGGNTTIVAIQMRGAGRPLVMLWPRIAQFKITVIRDEYLDAVHWDNDVAGATVKVYRPWDLRAYWFSYIEDGITYTDRGAQERRAVRDGESEIQRVVRQYAVGHIITATSGIQGGVIGSLPIATETGQTDIAWLDDNRAGRAWAKAHG